MRLSTLTLAWLPLLGCTNILPPVETPSASPPTLAVSPPIAPGHGRLVVDVVDGETDVVMLTTYRYSLGRSLSIRSTDRDLLCTSPCSVDLPFGRYRLGFPMHGSSRRLERVTVEVGPHPFVHRRALGTLTPAGAGRPLGILGTVLGAIGMVVGAVFLPVGVAVGDEGMTIAGSVNLGGGALLLTLGILGIALDPKIEQPGSGISFPLQ